MRFADVAPASLPARRLAAGGLRRWLGRAAAALGVAALLAAPAAQAADGAELVLLGVAGGPTWYGNEAPHGISSALVVDGKAYLVDLGSGAYRQLRRAGIKPGAEQAVFLTHLHTDHIIDLARDRKSVV